MTESRKPVRFHGSSLKDLRAFPESARQDAGFQLDQVQRGFGPDDWRPMKTIGSGVREIRIHDAHGAYRVIYIAQLASAIHVLHCFEKKSQRTSRQDIALARERYRQLLMQERTDGN